MEFFKVQGCGNHFILLENIKPNTINDLANYIKKLCNPNFGIGADGVIFLHQEQKKWRWEFYNDDGSIASICGNAARAVMAFRHTIHKDLNFSWDSLVGKITTKYLSKDIYSASWTNIPKFISFKDDSVDESLNDLKYKHKLTIGNNHLVLGVDDFPEQEKRLSVYQNLRNKSEFKNYNLSIYSPKTKKITTFENGLDRESFACGSAAIASFLATEKENNKNPGTLKFKFPGGELEVSKNDDKIYLTGNASIVFKGKI